MRITHQQALDCFASDDLIGIGMEADAVRRSLHPENVVTYTLDATLDATSGTLTAQLQQAIAAGATGIRLLQATPEILAQIHRRHPKLALTGPTATQILAQPNHTLEAFQAAGLTALLGGDTPLLTDAASPWLQLHRAAHHLGLTSTVSLTFGAGETPEQRLTHFELLRTLQEETNGFTAFLPLAAGQSPSTPDEPTAVEFLKTLAISRLYLDNIPNIQTSWHPQGLKVLQMGLRFGSNDIGSVLLEPNAPRTRTTEEDLRRIVRGAGFQPAERDALYRTFFLA